MKTITKIGTSNIAYFASYLNGVPSKEQRAFGIIDDGEAAGASVFSVSDGICRIEHLWIAPEQRRKGAGSELLDGVMDNLMGHGVTYFLAYYDGDEGTTAFLRSKGFSCAPGNRMFRVSVQDLVGTKWGEYFTDRGMAIARKVKRPKLRILTFDKLSRNQRRKLRAKIVRMAFDPGLLRKGTYDKNFSYVLKFHSEIVGVLIADTDGRDIYVKALLNFDANVRRVSSLVGTLLLDLKENDYENIYFLERNVKITRGLSSILGEDKITQTGMGWSAVYRRDG